MGQTQTAAGTPAKPKPKPRRGAAPTWRRRLDVATRAIGAVFGGYLFASLGAAVLARLLPGPVEEATITATLLSFAIYAAVAVWCFGDPKPWRLWLGLTAACAAMTATLWVSLILEPRL